jgi:hypothetical protein
LPVIQPIAVWITGKRQPSRRVRAVASGSRKVYSPPSRCLLLAAADLPETPAIELP